MAPKPTLEQTDIVETFVPGDKNLVVEAGAGCGKTAVLKMAARAVPKRKGLYIAYNKAIAVEAQKSFPDSVTCKTSHALAFGAVGRKYAHRLKAARMKSEDVAKLLKINSPIYTPTALIPPAHVARIVMATVTAFTRSGRTNILSQPVPRIPGLDDPETMRTLAAEIPLLAKKAWDDICDPRGQLPFSHDCYLKIFCLSDPQLTKYDYVLLDEAQDCQPAGTIVMTPNGQAKIEDLQAGDRVISYTGRSLRLRMQGSEITNISKRPYDGDLVTVRTHNDLASSYTPGHICIAKIGTAFEGKTLVYLMRRGNSFRVGVTSAYHGKGGKRRVSGLASRLREEDGDEIWVLVAADDKRNALMLESSFSARYGIPEMRFRDNGQRSIGQNRLDAFWKDMGDLTENAERCLNAYGRDIRYPLAKRSFAESGHRIDYVLYSRASTVRACNLMSGMEVLDARPLLGRKSQLATRNDEAWTKISVRCEQYTGDIWSMEVADDHTYVGDNIVTHNCNPPVAKLVESQRHAQLVLVGDSSQSIYGWRGAQDAMSKFNGVRLTLSQSFRFGPAVAEEANVWLEYLDAPLRLRGFDQINSRIIELDEPDAILCRTNGTAMAQVMQQLQAGRRVSLVGGGDQIRKLAEAAIQLKDGRGCNHPELFAFKNWGELQDYVEEDEGSDLRPFVNLIDEHGPDVVLDTVSKLVTANPEVEISTAHKAKGREWYRVQVAADFPEPKPTSDGKPGRVSRPDAMLAYVTVTRAQYDLDNTGLSWIHEYV